MASYVNKQIDHYEASAVDDGDKLACERQDRRALSPIGMFATDEDYVEERYKVDRRKLEQMMMGRPIVDRFPNVCIKDMHIHET